MPPLINGKNPLTNNNIHSEKLKFSKKYVVF